MLSGPDGAEIDLRSVMRLDDDQIGIALDGVGRDLSPDDVEPRSMLLLAASFFALVEAIADDEGMDLGLRGLRIIDKCSAAVTRSLQPTLAERIVIEDVPRVIAEPDTASAKAVASAAKAFRDQVIRLGSSVEVMTIGHDRQARVEVGKAPPERTGFERIVLRVFVVRVGGKDATAQLQSRAESRPFTLDIDDKLATELAPHLYREVEIEARVQRRVADLSIAAGRVTSFVAVQKGYGLDEWREYLRPTAAKLAGQDLEERLKRG